MTGIPKQVMKKEGKKEAKAVTIDVDDVLIVEYERHAR